MHSRSKFWAWVSLNTTILKVLKYFKIIGGGKLRHSPVSIKTNSSFTSKERRARPKVGYECFSSSYEKYRKIVTED